MNLQEARQILGVSEDVSPEDAKKKYKTLARTLHPDINKEPGAEERFKKINEAYQCIQTGKGTDREDQFEDFQVNPFQNIGMHFGFGNHFGRRQQVQHEHISLNTIVSFQESILGCKRDLKFSRKGKCPECDGNGKFPIHNGCDKCNGIGTITQRQNNMIFTQTCNKCGGRRQIKNCTKCNSTGSLDTEISVQVSIPGGVQNNNILRLSGMGNFAGSNDLVGDQYTDAHLHIQVTPEQGLSLVNTDVVSTIEVSLLEALVGCKKTINTVLGNKEITVNPKSRNLEEIVLPNLGVNKQGSHRVILDVKYPDNIDNLVKILCAN